MGMFMRMHKQHVDMRQRLYELAKEYVITYEAQDSELIRWYGSTENIKAERELAEFFGWERDNERRSN